MWSVSILLGLLRHVNILIAINSPTGLFVAFFQHLLQFTMHVLVYGCCASVSVVRGACSLMPLHAISWRCPLPLLMWRRASVVTNLWCRRANARLHENGRKSIHDLGWDGKEPKQCAWLPTSCLFSSVHLGLIHHMPMKYKWEYSRSYAVYTLFRILL